jgi:hypothetical protein
MSTLQINLIPPREVPKGNPAPREPSRINSYAWISKDDATKTIGPCPRKLGKKREKPRISDDVILSIGKVSMQTSLP